MNPIEVTCNICTRLVQVGKMPFFLRFKNRIHGRLYQSGHLINETEHRGIRQMHGYGGCQNRSDTDTEPVCIQVTISEGGTYAYISGDGDTWTKSSGLPLTFRVKNSGDDSETFRNFKGVKVDGKPLTNGQQYGASRGSVVIKLKPVCLETLSVGEHALTAEFKDGRAEAG